MEDTFPGYHAPECECDWCQWEAEVVYCPGGGFIAAMLLRMRMQAELRGKE